MNNQTLNTTECLLNVEINPCSVPVFSLSFLLLNTDSVGHASRENMTQVDQGAANEHHINTSCQCNLNNKNSHHAYIGSFSAAWSMTIRFFSGNVLYNHKEALKMPPQSVFSAPTSRQVDTPVWTAVSTVNSCMYSNNQINNDLTN